MDNTLNELVTIVEEIKEELNAIYLRKQNKMTAELKLQVKRIQDIRLRHGMINSNLTNWTCPDCIYTVLAQSVIPFIESRSYTDIKESLLQKVSSASDLLNSKVFDEAPVDNGLKKPKGNIIIKAKV